MNPIELYRRLPKKNCGKCPQKSCMPFALSVIKGDAELSECPYLTGDVRADIEASLKRSDWREELINKLKEESKNIRFPDIAAGIGADLKDDALVIKCMGREFIISSDGEITTRGHITPWIKILLLHYIRTAGKGELSGKWISYGEMKSGMVKASSFQRECEEPLKEFFDNSLDETTAVLQRLGAAMCEGFPTPYAFHLYLLPKIPVVILYWHKEEEFDSKVKILFDSTVDRFLDAESVIFLVEGLVKNVEAQICLDKKL